MTNEQKARELSRVWSVSGTEYTAKDCLMQMAEWKEQQMIDKSCEWWENELTYPTMSQVEIDWYQTKIVAFKKAMGE